MDLSILDKQIFERFIRPTVNKKPQYVGVEFELPLVNLKSAPVDFAVVHALVDAFLEHFGFVPVARDDEGAVCSAQSEENGDDISFDCSYNTLELSFGRVRDLNRIEEWFHSYYRFIRSFLRQHGHSITGMGINPRYLYNHREPVPNGRYRMLLNHLNAYERYTDRMVFHDLPFFGMMACSSQTHIDVNRDELLRVEPLKALLFANSPYGGEYLCARDCFWRCSMHGVNPHNVDGWDYGVSSIEELVAYIRYATVGRIEAANCHPFVWDDQSGRTWTLVHNGTLFESGPTSTFVTQQEGATDSERLLLYIVSRMNRALDASGGTLEDG